MHAAVSFDHRPADADSSRLERLARQAGPLVNFVGSVIGVGWLFALLFQHLQLVTQVAPQEFNEPGEWYTTWLLANGRNPFAHEELVGAASFFGPLYHWVVIAFKPLFGLGYPAHRMVNLLCIGGSLWLLVSRMQRLGSGLGVALLSAALFYWMCLQNIMVCARPDALGLLLCLLATILPWERDFSRRSVALGVGFAVLAFHCKAYFALGLLPLVLGVGCLRSWRAAVFTGAAGVAAIVTSVWVLTFFYPLYYDETLVMQRNSVWANSQDPDIVVMHATMLLSRCWPFLLLLAGAAYPFFAHLRRQSRMRLAETAVRWRAPGDAADRRLLVLVVTFACNFALVGGYMGTNGGATFTYQLHLVVPLLLLLTAAVCRNPVVRSAFGAALIPFALSLLHLTPVLDASPGYERLRQLIADHDPVYCSMSAGTELLAELDRPVINTGYTLFLPFITMHDRIDRDPHARAVCDAYDRAIAETEAMIKARKFQLILTTNDASYFSDIDLVHANYDLVDHLHLPMYFGYAPIEIWQPKPGPIPAQESPRQL